MALEELIVNKTVFMLLRNLILQVSIILLSSKQGRSNNVFCYLAKENVKRMLL